MQIGRYRQRASENDKQEYINIRLIIWMQIIDIMQID